MKLFIFILIFLVMLHGIEAYRILAIFPFPGKSHMFIFEKLMKELVKEGHTVDVVSHFPLEKSIPRYNDLSVNGTAPIITGNFDIDYLRANTDISDVIPLIVHEFGAKICKALFDTTVLQSLKFTHIKYDLLITQVWGVDCFLGFKHIFNIPVVSLLNIDLPWGATRIGNPDNPSYIPNCFSTFSDEMNLYDRFINTKELITAKWMFWKYQENFNVIAREFFGNKLPDLQELAKQTNLILGYSHFTTFYARPMVPNFIEVGGLHIDFPKPLSEHFNNLVHVEHPFKGVIYFSMGTIILTETFSKSKLIELFETFRQVPYKILWRINTEKIPKDLNIPSNIYFESWMPQLDLLCHKNVKLFISHGGISGTQEAVYCGVPILGIPIIVDQKQNIKSLEKKGLALSLEYKDIFKIAMIDLITQLTENPKYDKNAKQLSVLFKDRPMSPLKTAIYWIEYVIRHKGAPHLKSAAANLNWIQYYLIDIVIIVIVSLTIIAYLIYSLILYTFNKYLFHKKVVTKLKAS